METNRARSSPRRSFFTPLRSTVAKIHDSQPKGDWCSEITGQGPSNSMSSLKGLSPDCGVPITTRSRGSELRAGMRTPVAASKIRSGSSGSTTVMSHSCSPGRARTETAFVGWRSEWMIVFAGNPGHGGSAVYDADRPSEASVQCTVSSRGTSSEGSVIATPCRASSQLRVGT